MLLARARAGWLLTPSFPLAASVNFLSGSKLPSSRQVLAVYPLFLFYFIRERPLIHLCCSRAAEELTRSRGVEVAWMILIQ